MTTPVSRLRHSRHCRSSFRRTSQPLIRCCVESAANSLLVITCVFSLLVRLQPCVSQDASADARQLAKMLSAATVRIETPTDVCSGVIVSSDGMILSVAHGLTATDRTVTVYLHDGRSCKATVQFRNADLDVAILRVVDVSGTHLPDPIQVQTDSSTPSDHHGKPIVFACGFPARETSGQSPVFRMGRIEAQDRNAIRTSCVLTAGDSGGPLVNVDGQLIGLHRRIGLGHKVNVHIPTRVIRAAVSEHVDLADLDDHALPTVHFAPQPSDRVQRELRARTVYFYSSTQDQPVQQGTLLAPSVVATKLSELPTDDIALTCGRSRETAVGFARVTFDRQLDVLLVRLNESSGIAVPPPIRPTGAAGSNHLFTGQVVYAGVNANIGVIARSNHRETAAAPRLGLDLLLRPAGLVVGQVLPLTAASDAELRPGDRLTKLADADVRTLDDVTDVLSQFQPGDRIVFELQRNETTLHCSGQLTFPADSLLQRTHFLDGRAGELSRRRTGFTGVIQHDAKLAPSQMGGPLVDSQGNCIGINIARCGRESVLAVPVERLSRLVESLTK
jgi:serine protease Do